MNRAGDRTHVVTWEDARTGRKGTTGLTTLEAAIRQAMVFQSMGHRNVEVVLVDDGKRKGSGR